MARTAVVLFLLLVLVAVLPTWSYSRSWGFAPSGLIAGLLVLLVIAWSM